MAMADNKRAARIINDLNDQWYRVRVGNFRTKEAAIKEKQKLELLEKKKFAVIKAQ